eukprot:TRINITY_DN56474_c0_g1_i1.p1 TRINITY_DN56474_c0_g1~~TRINITY_DN56474_c0_g1_i1.p1  ORF type:complete len:160 (-),score=19.69 TRINITY_DN56474_c0_g1_i1:132-611(-)
MAHRSLRVLPATRLHGTALSKASAPSVAHPLFSRTRCLLNIPRSHRGEKEANTSSFQDLPLKPALPSHLSRRLVQPAQSFAVHNKYMGQSDITDRIHIGIFTTALFVIILWIRSLTVRKMSQLEEWEDLPIPPEVQQRIDAVTAQEEAVRQELEDRLRA